MKKLLAMYICVSALIYGFDTNASGLDMPPHDNSYTHYSLVPESVFDNSSSYQIARTYFMPDYQRNLVGKRVNDGGKGKNDKNCGMYGYVDSCPEHRVGSGVKHPIPGLTCYKECVCPDEYKLSSCPDGMDCKEQCDGKYKEGDCKEDYTKTDDGKCEPKGCESYGGYSSCPYGYGVTENFSTPSGTHCVKCSQCNAGTYSKGGTSSGSGYCRECPCGTYSKAGASSCTACPDGTYQSSTGRNSCTSVNTLGWTISSDKCSISKKNCPAGYTAGVTTCSTGSYSSNGYSGDDVCGKCTLSDECPSGYSKTACTSSQKETGRTTTEAGTACYKCAAKDDNCPSGYQKTACSSTQTQTATTTTEAGTACYKCEALPICPTGQIDTATYWCTVPITDCEALGYSSVTCTALKKKLRCPFDSSMYVCF